MASLYLSYKLDDDTKLAERLAAELTTRGHRAIYAALGPGGDWRQISMKSLSAADVVIPLLTERGLGSPHVMGEIGSARALFHARGAPLLMPIVVGEVANLPPPPMVSDLYRLKLRNVDSGVGEVAAQIVDAWEEHARRSRAEFPRIFISHRHTDVGVVETLVKLIECAFDVKPTDLRCTSVQPYKLRAGERTSDRLKSELNHAEAVLGILTPNAKASSYVLFELGASWGRGGITFPILARGASLADVPAPIGDLHTLSLADVAECHQFIDDLADVVTLPRRTQPGGLIAQLISELVTAAKPS
jgi:hypothetical protein